MEFSKQHPLSPLRHKWDNSEINVGLIKICIGGRPPDSKHNGKADRLLCLLLMKFSHDGVEKFVSIPRQHPNDKSCRVGDLLLVHWNTRPFVVEWKQCVFC